MAPYIEMLDVYVYQFSRSCLCRDVDEEKLQSEFIKGIMEDGGFGKEVDEKVYSFVVTMDSPVEKLRLDQIFSRLLSVMHIEEEEGARRALRHSVMDKQQLQIVSWRKEQSLSSTIATISNPASIAILLIPYPLPPLPTTRKDRDIPTSPPVSKKPRLDNKEVSQLPTSQSGDSIIPDESEQDAMANKAEAIAELLRDIHHENLHDPHKITILPCPALKPRLTMPSKLRDVASLRGHPSLKFIGRSYLRKMLEMVMPKDKPRPAEVVMYGARGAGAKYLATAAAASLLGQQQPVVFYQCSKLTQIRDVVDAVFLALQCSQAKQNVINNFFYFVNLPQKFDGVAKFFNWAVDSTHFLFILLDFHLVPKHERATWRQLAHGHTLVTVGDINDDEIFFRTFTSDAIPCPLQPGLDENEKAGWKSILLQGGLLLDQTKVDEIFELTGAIPFYVQEAITAVEKKGFYAKELILGSKQILEKLDYVIRERIPKEGLGKAYLLIRTAIANQDGPNDLQNTKFSPDRSSLQWNKEGHAWMPVSPLHHHALVAYSIQFEGTCNAVTLEDCLDLVVRWKDHPVMAAISIKKASIYALKARGLLLESYDDDLEKTETLCIPLGLKLVRFHSGQIPTISEQRGSWLLVPDEFNYPNIDMAAALFDQKSKTVTITVFQVTTLRNTSKHARSIYKFFTKDWKEWKKAIQVPDGWGLKWEFVWMFKKEGPIEVYMCVGPSNGRHPTYREWMTGLDSEVFQASNSRNEPVPPLLLPDILPLV